MGAIVAGRKEIIDAILQFSPSYRYNTALSPVIAAGMSAAIQLIQQENWRRQRLQQNIQTFNQYAIDYQLPLVSAAITPIRILRIGDTVKVIQLQDYLLEQGYYVAAIRAPTVTNKQSCLRISLNALHEESEIKQLLTKICDFLS
jgi:8-amino-7-oxononanoate synthase